MTSGQGKGGWLWPGRGLFRSQSRGVHSAYAADYAAAPANRKDIFEGTVNVHWKVGVDAARQAGRHGFRRSYRRHHRLPVHLRLADQPHRRRAGQRPRRQHRQVLRPAERRPRPTAHCWTSTCASRSSP